MKKEDARTRLQHGSVHECIAKGKGVMYAPRRECAESQYKKLYRFEEGNVEWMADHFLEHSGERRGGALTAGSAEICWRPRFSSWRWRRPNWYSLEHRIHHNQECS